MKNQTCQGSEGFTLLELMVVIAIVGVLASIALPSYLNHRQRALDAACLANRRNIETAESTYFASNDIPSLSIGTAYSCPAGGVYVWLVSDPEEPDYPTVACSVHYAGSIETPAEAADSSDDATEDPSETLADAPDSPPETPSESMQALIDDLEGLGLPGPFVNELTNKLNNTINSYENNKTNQVTNKLNRILDRIKDKSEKGRITDKQRDNLNERVQALQNMSP
jgi:prepilin-type N-terminal cleavage/methylation domain-containing protein